MLLEKTLEIVKKILSQTDILHIELRDALNPVYVEYDEETLEEKEDQEFPDEFDIVVNEDLSHADIQTIDDLLAEYSTIEMRLREGKLEIFQTDEEEA